MNFKEIFLMFIILFLILLVFNSSQVFAKMEIKEKIKQEVLKEFEAGEEKVGVIIKLEVEEGKEINKEDAKTLEILKKLEVEGDEVYKNYIYKEVDEKELEELKGNVYVEDISKSYKIEGFLQDSVGQINASITHSLKVSNINLTGTEQTVCVVDSGIDFTHPDLIGKNKSCVIDCYNKTCVENCSMGDDCGHGTHVAGIVGASGGIIGVSPNISLIGVKVLDSNGDGSENALDLSRAIDYCVGQNVSVITMSLGTGLLYDSNCDELVSAWTESIDDAFAKNISVVIATGNQGNYNSIAAPACISNATPVGSVRKDDLTIDYNRNSLVQILGIGYQINSTKVGGGYIDYSGTSMATPHVAGVIAIINQFLNLTTRTKTPSQIEELLNSTGKIVNDASSDLNFSRINIYSAILSLDNLSPNVSLISPNNNNINLTQNQTFSCNASDWQLSNITFYLWNSSGLVYNRTLNISGIFNKTIFNVTNLDHITYEWNCLAYDEKGNFASANSNFTLIIGGITTNLLSPLNNTYTNINVSFNCSAETELSKELTNITFFVWNSSNSLIYNLSQNKTGIINESIFNYNFTNQGVYEWSCQAYNNRSESIIKSNYTITYDVSNPNITLISPSDSSSYTSNSQSIGFSYNVSDANEITNCSLVVNSLVSLTNTSINQSLVNSFTKSFSPGSYTWNLNCTDSGNNQANSSTRSFTVTALEDEGGSGGGGGGGGISYLTYVPSIDETSKGYTKSLRKNDKVKFNIKEDSHILTVIEIAGNIVNLTIQSNLTTLVLGVGQFKKLNLSSENYYDFYVKLNSIEDSNANLTIKEIYELIPEKEEKRVKINVEETITKNDEETEIHKEELLDFEFLMIGVFVLIGVFIIILLLIVIIKIRKKEVKIKKYKKKFKERSPKKRGENKK